MARYLILSEDTALFHELEELMPLANNNPNGGLDLALVPYLKRLNRIYGVATEQSCSGHDFTTDKDREEYGDDYRHIQNGHLWIRLSRKHYYRFLEKVHELTDTHYEIYVKLYFARFDKPHDIVEIHFGEIGHIEGVMEHITRFFETL